MNFRVLMQWGDGYGRRTETVRLARIPVQGDIISRLVKGEGAVEHEVLKVVLLADEMDDFHSACVTCSEPK